MRAMLITLLLSTTASAQCDALYAPVASINAGYATGVVFSIEGGLWPVNARIGALAGPMVYSRQEVAKGRTETFVELDVIGRLVYRLTDLGARFPQAVTCFGTVKGVYGGSYRGYISLSEGEMLGVEAGWFRHGPFVGITFCSKL